MVTFRNMVVILAQLFVGQNVRLVYKDEARTRQALKIEELAKDIETVGMLKTPLTVWRPDPSKDEFQVLAGHRRLMALQLFFENNPKRYRELFPDGIPVSVAEGIDESEAVRIKVDHGPECPLTNPLEVQMCANMLFDQRATEAEVAVSLNSLMERVIGSLGGKSRLAYAELAKELAAEKAKETPKKSEIKRITEEMEDVIAKARRGTVQGLKNVWRCPEIVMHCLYFAATGERPEGVKEDVKLIPLNGSQVKRLADALDVDIKADAQYGKRRPGPAFKACWQKLVELKEKADAEKADKPETVNPKAMSAKAIIEEKGNLDSQGLKLVADVHAGQSKASLKEIDHVLYVAELVKEHDGALWAQCEAAAALIEETLNEAVVADVNGPATETTEAKS